MHLVFELIASMNEEEPDKTTLKTENQNRNKENRRQIINFIADNVQSYAKLLMLQASIYLPASSPNPIMHFF